MKLTVRRTFLALGGPLCAAAFVASAACASVSDDAVRRLESAQGPAAGYEEAFRGVEQRDRAQVQVGGWYGLSVAGFSSVDKNRATPDAVSSILLSDLRLWSRVWLRDGTTAYVRLRALGYNFGSEAGLPDPNVPNDGVDVDLGYVDSRQLGIDWRLGRQFIQYGSGVTLAGPLDALRSFHQAGNFSYGGFIGKNKPRELDLDSNITRPHRIYTGADVAYQRHDNHRLFGYFLAERDKSGEPAGITAATQGFHFDANYFGFGSDGRINPLVDYHLEGIRQTGDEFALGTGAVQNDVKAWAGVASVVHHKDITMHPTYSAEYDFATGDAGRLPGLTTLSGNAPGSIDSSFLGFGHYDLGIALNPRLSNLHVLRLGVTLKPWEKSAGFENLTLGGKFSLYRKDDAGGGITDPVATVASSDVGNGLDFSLGWRLQSDLMWLVQYGVFNPGDAYPIASHESTNVIFSNLTMSF